MNLDSVHIMMPALLCYLSALQTDTRKQVLFGSFGVAMLLQWAISYFIDINNFHVSYMINVIIFVGLLEVISKIRPLNRACVCMSVICIAGMLINMTAGILFVNEISHAFICSLIFLGVYIAIFMIMFNGKLDVGYDRKIWSASDCIHYLYDSGRVFIKASNRGV